MKCFLIVVIVFITISKMSSQEIPIWEFYSYEINSFDFINNDEIIVHTNNNFGTSYIMEISTGNILDSINHGLMGISDFDKYGNLISLASNSRALIIDYNTKEIVANIGDFGMNDIGFKDLNELFIIQDFGLVSYNIIENKIDTIWDNLPLDSKYNLPVSLRSESCFSFDNNNAILYWGGTQGVYCFNIDCNTGDLLYSIAGKEPISNPAKDEYFIISNNLLEFYNCKTKHTIKTIDLNKYAEFPGFGYFSYSKDGNIITTFLNNELYLLNNDEDLSLVNKFLIFSERNVPHLNYLISQNNKYIRVYDINTLSVKDASDILIQYRNGKIIYNLENSNYDNFNFSLVNVNGSIVKSIKLIGDSGILDVGILSNGIYIISLNSDKLRYSKKITILN